MIGAASAVALREARASDARAIAEVHVAGWRWGYRGLLPDSFLATISREQRLAMWERALTTSPPQSQIWVAVDQGPTESQGTSTGGAQAERIIGFVSFRGPTPAAPDAGEIMALYQLRQVSGSGVGRALMDKALQCLTHQATPAVFLWVLETNQRARRFYERARFFCDGGNKSEVFEGLTLKEVRYWRPL